MLKSYKSTSLMVFVLSLQYLLGHWIEKVILQPGKSPLQSAQAWTFLKQNTPSWKLSFLLIRGPWEAGWPLHQTQRSFPTVAERTCSDPALSLWLWDLRQIIPIMEPQFSHLFNGRTQGNCDYQWENITKDLRQLLPENMAAVMMVVDGFFFFLDSK